MEDVLNMYGTEAAAKNTGNGIHLPELKDLVLISLIVGCEILVALVFSNIFPA